MAEAVAQLQKGLDLLGGLPEAPWRRQHELDLQVALVPALTGKKGYSAFEVAEAIARARVLAQHDRPEYLVPLLSSQFAFHLVRSEHKLALSIAEDIEEIGERRNDVVTQSLGLCAKGWACWYLGEFVAARTLLEQSHDLAGPAHRVVGGELSDPYAMTLVQLAATLAHLGYIDRARSRMKEALSEARRLGHAHTLADVLSLAFAVNAITGSPEMHRHAEELLALSTEHAFPLFSGFATTHRGFSLTVLGQAQEGLPLLTQGLAAVRANGAVLGTPALLTGLAVAHVMLGQAVDGLKCLAEAAQIIETTEERVFEAALHRVRGELFNATGNQTAAEQSYHQALAIAARQSAKVLELGAATSLARLWRDQGKRTEARDLLAPIYDWFTEGFDTRILKEAEALLDELA